MQTSLINEVPHILNLGHTKCAFLQIGTQFVLTQGLEDLWNMVKVLFPTLVKDQGIIQIHYQK